MIWLVKLRLSSLCGRTIEFRMSTSAGIRTRQPAAWTRAPGEAMGRGGKGQGGWGHRRREGSLSAHLCSGLMPPVTHTGPGTQQALGKCLLKENTHTHTHTNAPHSIRPSPVEVSHSPVPLGSHTQDGDSRQQLPILEEALTVHVGSGVIGIGVVGGALHTGPAPHGAPPAHDAVQNTRVLLPNRTV